MSNQIKAHPTMANKFPIIFILETLTLEGYHYKYYEFHNEHQESNHNYNISVNLTLMVRTSQESSLTKEKIKPYIKED